MKNLNRIIRVFVLSFLTAGAGAPVWAAGDVLFSGTGEFREWMGVYYKEQKVGRLHSTLKWSPDFVRMNTSSSVDMRDGDQEMSLTATLEVHLNPDLTPQRFSMQHNVLGYSQSVQGRVHGGRLIYSVQSKGYSKETSIAFGPDDALYETFYLNLVRDGLKVGRQGILRAFDETSQTMVNVDYLILRKETVPFDGSPVEAYAVSQIIHGSETVFWVTQGGSLMKEVMPEGLVSLLETQKKAEQGKVEAVDMAALADFFLIPSDKKIAEPEKKTSLKVEILRPFLAQAFPADHRQKILSSKRFDDGSAQLSLLITTEPADARRPLPLSVASPEGPDLLEDSPEVQSRHPEIAALAMELKKAAANSWEAALAVNQWLLANIEEAGIDNETALDALTEGRGSNASLTYLSAALTRAMGIPTKIVNGLVYSAEANVFYPLIWPEVYVGEWRALDPTLGQDIVDATHIKILSGARDSAFLSTDFYGGLRVKILGD